MKIELIFFGQLTDIAGAEVFEIDNPGTISALKKILNEKYPLLANTPYTIALNNKMVTDEDTIFENSRIAFMPPFSGG